jgi:predicted phosphoribosyltransferase
MSHLDDGIATGATTRAALRATLTRNPKKLVLAVPVAPTSTLDELRGEADYIVCLEDYEFFGARCLLPRFQPSFGRGGDRHPQAVFQAT